jgi:ABC-type glycerol-3-phosphate transport system permease component
VIRDFRRSFAYYFENPPELPREMATWWGGQGFEAKIAIAALLAICAIYTLVYLRPIVGSFLAIFLPYTWINSNRMRALFFRGTQSEFELTWKARGQPTNARWRYLFDVIYYTGPILIVIATLAVLFIVFVGYPGYLRGI